MQDRYAGDIGDYMKFALLRQLAGTDRRFGIAWWLYADPSEKTNDGRHTRYLHDPDKWRARDPELFDALKKIVTSNNRSIAALEAARLLPRARYASDLYPTVARSNDRLAARKDWFRRTLAKLAKADIVFADPDNGLAPDTYSPTLKNAGKSITVDELCALSGPTQRPVVVYHHQTRRKGGHLQEIETLRAQLETHGFSTIDAVRCSAYSARVFFLLNADAELRRRAQTFCAAWQNESMWLPGN